MEIILFLIGLSIGGIAAFIFAKKLFVLQEQLAQLFSYKGKFEEGQNIVQDLKNQNQILQKKLDEKSQKLSDFEKQNELLKQAADLLLHEKEEWTKNKEKILLNFSEELIRKNNEEQAKFSKNQEERITKINADLYKNFENVLNKVGSLQDDVVKSNQEITLTKNALLNPSGAGKSAEITLENILKASGLKEKISINNVGDYILQSHFLGSDNSARKPDAIIFLPSNHNVIIDSKSSSHFLDLQKAIDAKDVLQEKVARQKLKETMAKHLEDLKRRDYAKEKEFSEMQKNNHDQIFTNVMFLQTEKMLEIINDIDENFVQKALDSGVWILTPIGLYNLLSQAKLAIRKVKQEENIDALKIEIRKLIENIATMFSKASDIGKSAAKTVKSYNDFAATFNQRFLVRVNNLNKMGIESDKKIISQKLEKYSLITDENIIEGETEEGQ